MRLSQIPAGVALVLIISMIALPSISRSTITLLMSSEPRAELLDSLNVTIAEISIHKFGFPDPDGWIRIWKGSSSYDLIRLGMAGTKIASAIVPVGRYDAVRLLVSNANSSINATLVRLELRTPSLESKVSFNGRVGMETILVLIIVVEIEKGDGTYFFKPRLKVEVR